MTRGGRRALACAVLLVAAFLGYRHVALGARVVLADAGLVATPPGTVRDTDEGLVLAYPDGPSTELAVRVRVRNTGTLPLRVTYEPWLVAPTLPAPTETVAVGAHGTAWLTLRNRPEGCAVRRVGDAGGWRDYRTLYVDVRRVGLGTRHEELALPFGIRLPGLLDHPCAGRP